MNQLKNILNNKVIGIVGSANSGKTTTLLNLIEFVKNSKYKTFCFCYHEEIKTTIKKINPNVIFFDTLNDFELIEQGFIFIDEFHLLLKSDDRHNTDLLKSVFNQRYHKDTIIILSSTLEYYNKLICGFIDNYIICKIKDFNEFVQGSPVKKYIMSLGTNLKGATCFNLPIGTIFYKGELINIKYSKENDKKNKINLLEGL